MEYSVNINEIKLVIHGQVWWLMPVIPAFGECKAGGSSKVRSQNQPSQHGETPSLLKIQKSQALFHLKNKSEAKLQFVKND